MRFFWDSIELLACDMHAMQRHIGGMRTSQHWAPPNSGVQKLLSANGGIVFRCDTPGAVCGRLERLTPSNQGI